MERQHQPAAIDDESPAIAAIKFATVRKSTASAGIMTTAAAPCGELPSAEATSGSAFVPLTQSLSFVVEYDAFAGRDRVTVRL